jgi:hypothetical protein
MLFWVGIGLGFILSLLASIVANLYASEINKLIEERKFKATEKWKIKEIAEFEKISPLATGERDKYIFFIYRATEAIIAVIAFSSGLILAILLGSHNKCAANSLHDLSDLSMITLRCTIDFGITLALLFSSVVSLSIAIGKIQTFNRYWYRIDRYDHYKTLVLSFKQKLPSERPKKGPKG